MKLVSAIIFVSVMLSSVTFAEGDSGNELKSTPKEIKQHLTKKVGVKPNRIESKFINSFAIGDRPDCDPEEGDCSGCGWFEKYMCEAMKDALEDL